MKIVVYADVKQMASVDRKSEMNKIRRKVIKQLGVHDVLVLTAAAGEGDRVEVLSFDN